MSGFAWIYDQISVSLINNHKLMVRIIRVENILWKNKKVKSIARFVILWNALRWVIESPHTYAHTKLTNIADDESNPCWFFMTFNPVLIVLLIWSCLYTGMAMKILYTQSNVTVWRIYGNNVFFLLFSGRIEIK